MFTDEFGFAGGAGLLDLADGLLGVVVADAAKHFQELLPFGGMRRLLATFGPFFGNAFDVGDGGIPRGGEAGEVLFEGANQGVEVVGDRQTGIHGPSNQFAGVDLAAVLKVVGS